MPFIFALATIGQTPALDRWGNIWSIVAGVLAALLFIGGLFRWAWLVAQRPRLVVESGYGYEFEKRIGISDQFVASAVENHTVTDAYIKLLRVRETRGKSSAKNVVARVRDVVPPHHTLVETADLRWSATNPDQTDIQPHGQKYLALQQVILYIDKDQPSDLGCRSTPPIFDNSFDEPRNPIEFSIELLVDGKKHGDPTRFRMVDPWPAQLFSAPETSGWSGWPDPISFPTPAQLISAPESWSGWPDLIPFPTLTKLG